MSKSLGEVRIVDPAMKKPTGRLIAIFILAGFLSLIAPQKACACTCGFNGDPQFEYGRADFVFWGKPKYITIQGANEFVILFEVKRVWKGYPYRSMRINENDCPLWIDLIPRVEIGKEYIIYAYGDAPQIFINECSRIIEIKVAGNDLKVLGEGESPTIEYQFAIPQPGMPWIIDPVWVCACSLIVIVFTFSMIILFRRKKKTE